MRNFWYLLRMLCVGAMVMAPNAALLRAPANPTPQGSGSNQRLLEEEIHHHEDGMHSHLRVRVAGPGGPRRGNAGELAPRTVQQNALLADGIAATTRGAMLPRRVPPPPDNDKSPLA